MRRNPPPVREKRHRAGYGPTPPGALYAMDLAARRLFRPNAAADAVAFRPFLQKRDRCAIACCQVGLSQLKYEPPEIMIGFQRAEPFGRRRHPLRTYCAVVSKKAFPAACCRKALPDCAGRILRHRTDVRGEKPADGSALPPAGRFRIPGPRPGRTRRSSRCDPPGIAGPWKRRS